MEVCFVISQDILLNKQSSDWWLETSWRSCGVTVITTPFRYYKWLRFQWESVEVSLVQVMACRLFGAKPLPEPVEGPVIWNVMTAMLRPCNNNAVITVITTRIVFIQIAKCTDRRDRTMGHAGSDYVFCLKCSHCCVYFTVLELLQPVPPGNPFGRPHWPASGAFGLPQPGDQMTLVWPSFSSTQICNFPDSFKWSTTHLIHLYLTDLICNGKSFQILGFTVHPCIFCSGVLLFVFKTQGDVWGNLVNYNANNTNRSKLFI